MTHLKIELNNGIIEEVSSEVIKKLYNIVHDNLLDNTSNLIGRLHTSATYQNYVDYLEDAFKVNGVKLLIIDANKLYIYFADPEVNRVLANRWGDGNGVTLIDMASVTEIPRSLFENNKVITSFDELNEFTNITSINTYVFKLCSALTSIDLSNITSIGNLAFANCSALTSVNLSNCTSIGSDVFNSCLLLTTVGDLSNCTSINNNTFANCSSLTSVGNLSNCISIGNNAFNSCSSLTSVGDTSNVTSIGTFAFAYCSSLTSIDLSNVITISNLAFANCSSLTSVGNLSNVTTIGNSAFNGCSLLTSVGDLSNVISIDNSAFNGCSSLTSVNLSDCTSIGSNVFLSCSSLTSVNLSSCTSIGNKAFFNCTSLTTVGDLSNCTSIGNEVFQNCSSLTTIGNLSNCTSIGRSAFSNCSNLDKTDWNLSNVTTLGLSSFWGCSKLKGTLNLSGLLTIDVLTTQLFYGCSSLLKIILGHASSVETSRMNANKSTFYLCDSLKVVDINQLDEIMFSNLILIDNNVFLAFIIRNTNAIPTITLDLGTSYATWSRFTSSSNAKIYVADSLYSTYINHADWSDLASHIEPLSNYVAS